MYGIEELFLEVTATLHFLIIFSILCCIEVIHMHVCMLRETLTTFVEDRGGYMDNNTLWLVLPRAVVCTCSFS